MKNLRTLEQERAKHAYEKIKEIQKEQDDVQKRYSSYVKSASVTILTNGLGNTLAYYISKISLKDDANIDTIKEKISKNKLNASEKAYAYLYIHIADWLMGHDSNLVNVTENKDPLNWFLNDADSIKAIYATQETLALLNWMTKFADAMLEKEKT